MNTKVNKLLKYFNLSIVKKVKRKMKMSKQVDKLTNSTAYYFKIFNFTDNTIIVCEFKLNYLMQCSVLPLFSIIYIKSKNRSVHKALNIMQSEYLSGHKDAVFLCF